MGESAILDDALTLASGFAQSKPAPQREEYELVNKSRVSQVVYPGPKMQMQVAIEIGDRQYLLRDVLIVEFAHEGEVVYASSRGLPVSGVGADASSALDDLCASFDFQYRNLVEVNEGGLTEGGKRRRASLSHVVEAVRPIEHAA